MHSLFRPEVLSARRTSWLGSISLAQPVGVWLMTVFAVVAGLAIVIFFVFGTYTRRTTVVGHLVPVQGMATVLSPATGFISRVDVPEGDAVEANQPIALITVPRATVSDGDTLAALESRLQRRAEGLEAGHQAQQQLLRIQSLSLSEQLETARGELRQVESEINNRQQQVRLAEETLERLQQLRSRNFVSELQIGQQQAVALERIGDMQVLQRQALTIRRQIGQIEQGLRELPDKRLASEANYTRELALLEQEQVENLARGELAIAAPVQGVIATHLFKPGQSVQAGQPLVSVLPGDGTLEAELLVPSRAIGFIEPGDTVLLRYQAFPYQRFGHHEGRVARISRSTVNASDASNEPFYRVNVSLEQQSITAYGKPEALKPGMLVDADVLGETRTLIQWILEPIYSLQGTVFSR